MERTFAEAELDTALISYKQCLISAELTEHERCEVTLINIK